jgi:hypothetical protein
MKKFLGLRGQALNLAVGTIAGCDFLLFGYGKLLPNHGVQVSLTGGHRPGRDGRYPHSQSLPRRFPHDQPRGSRPHPRRVIHPVHLPGHRRRLVQPRMLSRRHHHHLCRQPPRAQACHHARHCHHDYWCHSAGQRHDTRAIHRWANHHRSRQWRKHINRRYPLEFGPYLVQITATNPPPRFPLGSPRPPKPTNAARWS